MARNTVPLIGRDTFIISQNKCQMQCEICSLVNSKILDSTKSKAFGDGKIYLIHMMISVSKRLKNIETKGENAASQHFLLFPYCFQKPSVTQFLKLQIVW